MRFLTRLTGAMMAICAFAANVALASPPSAPNGLSGHGGYGPSGECLIYANWRPAWNPADSSFSHDGSRVYLGIPQGGMIYFRQVMEVTDTIPGYAAAVIPVNSPTRYYLYVTTFNGDGESPSSDTILVEFDQREQIHYPSSQIYIDTLRVGVEFSATFQAQGPANRAIVYSLGYTDAHGATYDAGTGLFRFTPSRAGRYSAILRARLQDDSTVTANAYLTLSVDTSNTGGRDSIVQFTHGSRDVSLMIGEELRDRVSATANNGGTIWYGLIGAPSAMTIDRATGDILWTATWSPNGSGNSFFSVVAGLEGESGHRASIAYRITVRDSVQQVSLVGWVRDSAGAQWVPADINIYSVVQQMGAVVYTLAAQASSRQGSFYVEGLRAGTYIAQAIPYDSSMYSPAYYVANGLGVLNWGDATRFTLSPNTFGDSIFIRVPYANGYRGSNHLDGSVVGNGGTIRKDDTRSLAGLDPVVGAVVYAIDNQGRVSAFDVTDDAGVYRVDGLGAGDYTILVDKVGYRPMTQTVTFAEDNGAGETIEVELQSASGGSSVPVDRVIARSLATIPNPATTSLRLDFVGHGSNVTLRLIDNMGREVLTRSVGTNDGTTSVELPVGGIAAGRYIVTISSEHGVAAAPLVIVR